MLLQRPRTKILRPAARWLARGLVYANTLSSHDIKDRNPILGKVPFSVSRNGSKIVAAPWGALGVGFTAYAGGTDTSDSFSTFAPMRMSARRTLFFRIALSTTQADGDVFWDNATPYERLQWDALEESLTWRRVFSGTTGIWSFYGLVAGGTYSLAIVHDGTTSPPVVYVNGIPVSVTVVQTPSGTVVTDTSSTILTFGGRAIFSQYAIPMKVGDLCVFNEVLTQSEVQELHRSRSALRADTPLNIWLDGPQTGWTPHIVQRKSRRPAARWMARELGCAIVSSVGGTSNVVDGQPAWSVSSISTATSPGGRTISFGQFSVLGTRTFRAAPKNTVLMDISFGAWVGGATTFDFCFTHLLGFRIYESDNQRTLKLQTYQSTTTGEYSAVVASQSTTRCKLAVLWDGSSTPILYVDGVKTALTTDIAGVGAPSNQGNSASFLIGQQDLDPCLTFGLHSALVFHTVLSESEIKALTFTRDVLWAEAPRTAWSGGLLDWVAPPFVRRSQPQIPVGADRRSLAVFTPSRAGRFTTRAGTMTPVITQFGRGLESSSTGNRIEQLNPNGVLLPSSRLSLFFVGRIGPTTGGIGVASVLNGVTNYAAMLYVYGGADYAGYYPYVGGSLAATQVPVKGYDIVLVGSYDGTTARVGVRNLSTNQKQINSSALSSSSDFDRFRVGPTFSSQLFSTYFSGAFLDPLSTGEINAILDNPWRLLTRDPYVLHGAAGISTGIPFLSLATVINILQTQATPRVTVTF